MRWFEDLPKRVVDLARTRVFSEYATLSAAGVPIDTPTFVFPSADLTSFDIGTGLAYPAKAERARRNPKVGLLLEGGPDDPVVSVAGMAAVRDSDLQGNLDRYLAETIFSPNINPDLIPWARTRETKRYYLTRVIVCVAPAHIRWWPSRRTMDEAPHEWRAPAGHVFAQSDPAPPGKTSDPPGWPQRGWTDLRDSALTSGLAAHLTLLDPDGYPLPIRVRDVREHGDGFSLVAPKAAPWSEGKAAPWSEGKATLSFAGREIFVGDARREGDRTVLSVERALPILPTVADRAGLSADTQAAYDKRLEQELARRGGKAPVIPETPPPPTEGAMIRQAATLALVDAVGNEHYQKD
jgi:hypothetical protein